MKRFAICLLMLVMCFPLSVWPQSPAADSTEAKEQKVLQGERAAKAKMEVQKRGTGEKSRVRVTLSNKTEVKGYISQIGTDSFQVTSQKSGEVTTIAYTDVEKVRGQGLSKGAKIAIAVGVAAGVGVGLAATLPKD
jgi:hypothetical protein